MFKVPAQKSGETNSISGSDTNFLCDTEQIRIRKQKGSEINSLQLALRQYSILTLETV